MSRGEIDVLAERQRQIYVEGFDEAHDEQWDGDELVHAAICYAEPNREITGEPLHFWPWVWQWWKPKDRRRDLVRAAALIIAEIDRIDRAASAVTP